MNRDTVHGEQSTVFTRGRKECEREGNLVTQISFSRFGWLLVGGFHVGLRFRSSGFELPGRLSELR